MSRRSSLSSRLDRLKKDGLTSPVENEKYKNKPDKKENDPILPGWEKIDTFVWRRSVLKENILSEFFFDSLLLPAGVKAVDLIFYDTETTGLSTGAGTIPFLIGLGRVRGKDFEIIQYFLADYPGEPLMLELLKKDFPEESFYVSYNGKSYDSHLINTRFLINQIDYKTGRQIDLLYLSRRLWKNKLENCRLGTIEEQVLNIRRGPDIPGSEIPDVWFDFLKTGNLDKLKLVFSHNVQDIYSLSLLLEKINDISANLPVDEKYDAYNLGKVFLLLKNKKGIDLLFREYESGHRDAGKFLSLYYKRQGDWENALSIWRKMNKKRINFFATVELAKYYEHKERIPEKALHIVEKLLKSPFCPGEEKKSELNYRKDRLSRKILH